MKSKKAAARPARSRRIIQDDSEDRGEGEWIGNGSSPRIDAATRQTLNVPDVRFSYVHTLPQILERFTGSPYHGRGC